MLCETNFGKPRVEGCPTHLVHFGLTVARKICVKVVIVWNHRDYSMPSPVSGIEGASLGTSYPDQELMYEGAQVFVSRLNANVHNNANCDYSV